MVFIFAVPGWQFVAIVAPNAGFHFYFSFWVAFFVVFSFLGAIPANRLRPPKKCGFLRRNVVCVEVSTSPPKQKRKSVPPELPRLNARPPRKSPA